MDLREVAAAGPGAEPRAAVLAPYLPQDTALQRRIATLRGSGEIVVVDLPGHEKARAELGCDRRLQRVNGQWKVVRS